MENERYTLMRVGNTMGDCDYFHFTLTTVSGGFPMCLVVFAPHNVSCSAIRSPSLDISFVADSGRRLLLDQARTLWNDLVNDGWKRKQ